MLIPVGTFFVSHDASKQNMVLTAAARVVLSDGGWNAVDLSVACTNISREAPSPSDSFDIWQALNQVELQQLMPVLQNADVDYATQQAAIWIVTDDANYAYLGILHRFVNGVDNGREIDETATARALQLLAQAGMPIAQKAIWQDRQLILKGVNDEELRQWLQRRILTG